MQAASLRLIQELQSLEGRTIVLAGKAKVQLDHGVLDALIIKPYAQHIPLDTPLQTLVQYMRQYVETVGCLYDAGYLHGDLSYSNLLITEDQAIISDWETMVDVEVSKPGQQLSCRKHMHIAVCIVQRGRECTLARLHHKHHEQIGLVTHGLCQACPKQ